MLQTDLAFVVLIKNGLVNDRLCFKIDSVRMWENHYRSFKTRRNYKHDGPSSNPKIEAFDWQMN
jgi:hypothetical protein